MVVSPLQKQRARLKDDCTSSEEEHLTDGKKSALKGKAGVAVAAQEDANRGRKVCVHRGPEKHPAGRRREGLRRRPRFPPEDNRV